MSFSSFDLLSKFKGKTVDGWHPAEKSRLKIDRGNLEWFSKKGYSSMIK